MKEFILFGFKQAYASIFGGYLLLIMIVTHFWYPFETVHRYDAIFLAAIGFQLFLLALGWESRKEAAVIFTFHIVATVMELFKTSDAIGAWHYPEEYLFGIGNVPLFTGFMYSAVGSYLARVSRIFKLRYTDYPDTAATVFLVIAIYINFFSHHFIADLRWILLLITFLLFRSTQVHFVVIKSSRKMPILFGWLLIALFIWLAENIATYTNIWIYPHQANQWQMVPWSKLTSWYLLMLLSFVLIKLIQQPTPSTEELNSRITNKTRWNTSLD